MANLSCFQRILEKLLGSWVVASYSTPTPTPPSSHLFFHLVSFVCLTALDENKEEYVWRKPHHLKRCEATFRHLIITKAFCLRLFGRFKVWYDEDEVSGEFLLIAPRKPDEGNNDVVDGIFNPSPRSMSLMGYKGMVWFSVRVTSTGWPSVAASVAMVTSAVECLTSAATFSLSISQPISSLRLECLRPTTERATEHAWKLSRMILWNVLATKAWLLILKRSHRKKSWIVCLLNNNAYYEIHETVNTWEISGMLIVWWPITIMFRTRQQTWKPQTNYRCCLRFSFLIPY